jgi:hypothetical protein
MREIDIPSARAERAHKPRRTRRTTFGLFYANRSQYRARARFVPSNPQGVSSSLYPFTTHSRMENPPGVLSPPLPGPSEVKRPIPAQMHVPLLLLLRNICYRCNRDLSHYVLFYNGGSPCNRCSRRRCGIFSHRVEWVAGVRSMTVFQAACECFETKKTRAREQGVQSHHASA